jgi:hypothetical protein
LGYSAELFPLLGTLKKHGILVQYVPGTCRGNTTLDEWERYEVCIAHEKRFAAEMAF